MTRSSSSGNKRPLDSLPETEVEGAAASAAAIRKVVRREETVAEIVDRWCCIAHSMEMLGTIRDTYHPLQAAIHFGTASDVVLVHTHLLACAQQGALTLGREYADMLLWEGMPLDSERAVRKYGWMVTEAVARNDLDMVRYLLSQGAPVEKDAAGANPIGHSLFSRAAKPPLHVAVVHQNAEMVRVLLDAGADVNLEFKLTGAPALFDAAEGEDPEILRLLLDRGANVYARRKMFSFHHESALHAAIKRKRAANVLLLLDRGATADINLCADDNTSPPLVAALEHDDLDDAFVEELIRRGADVQLCAPLVKAAQKGRLGAVRALLAARADVAATDGDATTALMRACFRQDREMVELLVNAPGAEATFEMTDVVGGTALCHAVPVEHSDDYRSPVVQLLLDKGVRIDFAQLQAFMDHCHYWSLPDGMIAQLREAEEERRKNAATDK